MLWKGRGQLSDSSKFLCLRDFYVSIDYLEQKIVEKILSLELLRAYFGL